MDIPDKSQVTVICIYPRFLEILGGSGWIFYGVDRGMGIRKGCNHEVDFLAHILMLANWHAVVKIPSDINSTVCAVFRRWNRRG